MVTVICKERRILDFAKLSWNCAFLLLTFGYTIAQNKEKDSSNVVYYTDKIMIRSNLNTQTDAYYLSAKGGGSNLDLETNNNYKLFFSVDYKFIGFSYGFYPKFFGGNKDEDLKGKSTFSDYNFRFFLGRWLQSVNYSKTKGFYVSNMSDFLPDWEEEKDGYIKFPDFKSVEYEGSTAYIFNPKFSLKSITTFTEWQKKSAGSFVPSFQYSYKKITSKTEDLNGKQKEYDLRLAAGYYYNFIIHDEFYIAANMSPSLGVKFLTDKSISSEGPSYEKDTYFTQNLGGGFKFGYNSERVLCGFSLNFNLSSYKQDKNTVISNDKIYGLLYFGYRFNAPNFIKKPVEKIDEKLNF